MIKIQHFIGTAVLLTVTQTSFAVIDFEQDVLPIFQEKCFRCHSDRIKEPEGGVLLDSAQGILNGSDYGSIIEKMQPEKSVLFQRLSMPEGKRGIMPPAGKGDPATPEQLQTVKQWIKEGARFGNWKGVPRQEAQRPPKVKSNTRLSMQKYGTANGIQLDLKPTPKYPTKMSNKLVRTKAAEVDKLIEQYRKANNIKSPKVANDRIFLRRAYLGIVGRTPTHDEAVAFLGSKNQNKRTKLIDHLINTEGYASNWFHFWADLLKVQTTRFQSSVYYGEWVKQALRDNMPYDKFAYELITATGMPYQNGATGWAAQDENMAPDHMANNMQAFLGMQLQCAQCHDHPYDRWNQYEFQSLVSYFGGMQWFRSNNLFTKRVEKEGLKLTEKQEKFFGNNMSYRYRQSIWEPNFDRWSRLPKDYQYADAKPNTAVAPQVIFGHQPVIADSPREAFGQWITAEDNKWFTVSIANRLWKQTMGVGLIEPVDNIKYDTEAQIPALMTYLEKTMKEASYNLKDFLRILYNTRTWQMETLTTDLPENLAEYHYEGRPLMRMTGEQMWDSLVSLAIIDPDERKGHGSRYTTPEYIEYADDIYFTPIEELVAYYTDEQIDAERQARKQAEREATLVFFEGNKKKKRAPGYGANFNNWSYDHMTDPRWHGLDRGLVRASELASPAPAHHFVRQFGQSDRKVIGSGRTDPNVTQVLNILNGPIHYILNNPKSELAKILNSKEEESDKLYAMFRAVLTRDPTEEDIEIASAVIAANKEYQGYRMILWALLNTREFMYIQ